ncbi:hypothetical protein V5O48_007598 [Marasmius crinis-equi]|uniref:Cytochrome P450 n=1 Tax=Marasmius crinis-equi TaxID=585013 RepID=A0ABR3FGP2_9AGAR
MKESGTHGTLVVIAIAIFVSALVMGPRWTKYRSRMAKLDALPTVGHDSRLFSYVSALRNLARLNTVIKEGYEKYPGRAFKVSLPDKWLVVVSGPDMLDDVRKASDEQLSLREAFQDILHSEMMFGKQTRRDPYHVDVIKNILTRSIAPKFDDMYEELATAFDEEIPKTREWTQVPVLKRLLPVVCRISNRVFVGLPLCRNKDWVALNVDYTTHVFTAIRTLGVLPKFIQPVVGWFISPLPASFLRASKHLRHMIIERLEAEDKGYSDAPDDLLTWFVQEAEGVEERLKPETLIRRMLNANFAAVHTTSNEFTNALVNLVIHPEYIEPLREEIERIIQHDGWTKAAMGKMQKLDSFLRESQRVSSSTAFGVFRKTLEDFTFSNGIVIPAGTFMSTAPYASHFDENNYPNAYKFDGFRFSRLREKEGEGHKHQMVVADRSHLNFGIGKHACPGRFFAVNELKALMSHVLLNYDIKLDDDNLSSKGDVFSPGAFRQTEVWFRKREVA